MNFFDMPSPGPITRSQSLLAECYQAIQFTRVVAVKSPTSDAGDRLRAFFLKCAEFCPQPDPVRAAELAAKAEAEQKALEAAAKAQAKKKAATGRRST